MDLTHRVRVPAPMHEVWAAVNDPVRLAGLVPGSQVDGMAGDTFTGMLKIKLGSALLAITGDGRYVSRDEGRRRVVIETGGTDRRSDAAVRATHTLSLGRAHGSDVETEVEVATSVTWDGRPSRLGEGVVADAVDRVVEQVGSRIAARVSDGLPWAPAAGTLGTRDDGSAAAAVVDHPVELGADLGAVDEPDGGSGSRDGRTGSRPPPPGRHRGRPGCGTRARTSTGLTATQPSRTWHAARTFSQVVLKRVLPYAGLGALAAFAAASAVRRARR